MAKRKNAAKAAAKAAHEARVANIIFHFETTYNAMHDRLAAFQQFCKDLDVEVGALLKQCKEVGTHSVPMILLHDRVLTNPPQNVKLAHVNIHDFVRVQQDGGNLSAVKFPSKAKLRLDIKSSRDRTFPLKRAKANEFLKAMLIHV